MIWFFALPIAAIVGTIAFRIKHRYDWYFDKGGWWACLLVIPIIATILAVPVGGIFGAYMTPKEDIQEEILIMQDGSGVAGHFSLFGGYVDEEMRFSFYAENNGVARLKSVPADDSVVIQDSANPYYTATCLNEDAGFWWINLSGGCSDYEFHVPEGSIAGPTVLDAE